MWDKVEKRGEEFFGTILDYMSGVSEYARTKEIVAVL